MSNTMQTPQERYLHDASFNRVVNTLEALMRERGWTYSDIYDAWSLAERKRHERQLLSGD